MPKAKEVFFAHPVVLSFLAVIAAIEFIRLSLCVTFLPSFLTKLQFDTAAIGIVLSANIFADNLFKSVMGWLVDRKGPWPVLFAGSLAVLSGVMIIFVFHQQLIMLILAAVLIGLGVSPVWPGVVSGTIQSVGETKRATAISLISVVWLAGGGLGPIIMGFLIDARMRSLLSKAHIIITNSYQTGLLIMLSVAFGVVLISMLGWFIWRRTPHINGIITDREEHKPRLKDILFRLWQVKALIPGMLFQTMSLGMLLPNLLPYATERLGLTEGEYSLLLIIGGVVVVLFMIPVGRLADHWGTKGLLVAGFSLAAFSLSFLALWGNPGNIWWIVAVTGLAYALIQPSWNALLAGVIPPEQRGALMGLFMSVEGLGFGIGPIIGGLLGTTNDYGLRFLTASGQAIPFLVSSICLGLMALVYLIYPFHRYYINIT